MQSSYAWMQFEGPKGEDFKPEEERVKLHSD